MNFEARVLTVSDTASAGLREDLVGPAVVAVLEQSGFLVVGRQTVADGMTTVSAGLQALVSDFEGLIVTTGGTGFSPTDLTPEATLTVVERTAPGLAEAMRSCNPHGRLSRGVAGTAGPCLIVNLPGSTVGALQSIGAIIDVLPHALELLLGGHPH